MAESICESFQTVAKRLMDLGLGYLTLGEETPSLSGGEVGGRIVAAGTPRQVAENTDSITGKYIL